MRIFEGPEGAAEGAAEGPPEGVHAVELFNLLHDTKPWQAQSAACCLAV